MLDVRYMIPALAMTVSACAPQPTELQKAQVETKLLACFTAVNSQRGADVEDNIFGALSALSTQVENLGEDGAAEPSWALGTTEDGLEAVSVKTRIGDTRYDCDYAELDSVGYELINASRNGERVYNRSEDQAIRAENKRLAEEREEAKRLEYVGNWQERSFSNVAYKYYEKPHRDDEASYSSAPTLQVICNPEGTQIEIESNSYSEKRDQKVSFIRTDAGTQDTVFDLTSSGRVGKYSDEGWINDVYSDEAETNRFISLMKDAEAIQVNGFTYNMDDLSQVPCLQATP